MSHLHTFTKVIWYNILFSFVALTITLWMTLKVLRKFHVREPPLSILTCFLGVTSGFINQELLSLFENEPMNKVADGWTNIQKQFSVECLVAELKKKKESLMAMFRQLLNKVKSSLKSGAGMDDIFKSSCCVYETMANFLQPVYSARDTINTEVNWLLQLTANILGVMLYISMNAVLFSKLSRQEVILPFATIDDIIERRSHSICVRNDSFALDSIKILPRNVKTANDLRRVLTAACNASMPRRTKKRNRGPVYWRTQEIACLRRDCLKARRAYTKRNIPDHMREIRGLSYKQAKKELRQAIRASKLSCWRKLIAEVDEDIWGKGYRTVFVTLRMGSPLPEMSLEKKKEIVQALFPDQARVTYINESCSYISLFARDELILAVDKLKTGKSPGPDGIPAEIVKYAIMKTQETFLDDGWKSKNVRQEDVINLNCPDIRNQEKVFDAICKHDLVILESRYVMLSLFKKKKVMPCKISNADRRYFVTGNVIKTLHSSGIIKKLKQKWLTTNYVNRHGIIKLDIQQVDFGHVRGIYYLYTVLAIVSLLILAGEVIWSRMKPKLGHQIAFVQ
nr:unnamed protein product [Callosobruchus analis]